MKRTQSFGGGYNQRQSLHAVNSGLRRSTPNAQVAALGRSLLERPTTNKNFSASAANTPLPRTSTDVSLKSCLSSKSSMASLATGKRSTPNLSSGCSPNEEFKVSRNVSFSHMQIREYEVTIHGENSSFSTNPTVSLGWRYNPQEKTINLDSVDTPSIHKSSSDCRLPTKEQRRQLRLNSYVSVESLSGSVQDMSLEKLQQRETLKRNWALKRSSV